jgi:lysophospholipase L1-like esterase
VPIEKFQNNLQELVNQAKKFTNKIIFIGLTKVDESKTMPIPWDTIKFYDMDNVSKYNSIIKNFCQKNKLLFIDMLDLLQNEDLEDGLHPNPQGHKKMFEEIKKFLVDNKIV